MSKFRANIRRVTILTLWLILLIALLSNFSVSQGGENQFAVTLIYFEADGRDTEVLLRWATATEIDTAGFILERSLSASGPFLLLEDIGFIPSLAEDGFSGAEYQRVDRQNINSNQTYYYVLIEIEVDGSENRTEPISVNSSQVSPTATVQDFVSTSQPTGTPMLSEPTITTSATRISPGTGTPVPDGTTIADSAANPSIGRRQNSTDDDTISNVTITQPAVESNPVLSITPTFEGYPAPENSSRRALQGNGESYPGPTAVLGFPPPTSGYPAASPSSMIPGERLTDQSSITIGSSPKSETESASDVERETQSAASTLILWLGFFAAAAIFIAGVAGSIYWFSNRRIRSR